MLKFKLGVPCFIGFGCLFLFACGQQDTARQQQAQDDEASQSAKTADLTPAQGHFSGSIILDASGQPFDATIETRIVMENSKDPESTDPSATISLPRLSGNLRFPAIDQLPPEDYPGFHALLDPLGGYATVSFDFGDYDPSSNALVLPYTVPGYSSGDFGELSGTLTGDHFQGTWFCKPYGTVGHFDLLLSKDGSS